jgi:hypothetical protein
MTTVINLFHSNGPSHGVRSGTLLKSDKITKWTVTPQCVNMIFRRFNERKTYSHIT